MPDGSLPFARVLIVDDEPDLEPLILQKFRHKIKDNQLAFVFARNGEEALAALHAHPEIEIVLSDINMPVMDGLTLLLRLNEFERLVKTVMVSAYDDMRNIRVAMNRGAFDFLTKPIDFHDFETTLNRTLEEVAALKQSRLDRDQLFALQNELSIASRIQQAILPRDFPQGPRFEIYARMKSARVVSGDFYDFFLLDDDHLAIAIADVSGKGIPAAIYMAVSRTLLRATAAQLSNPGECLEYVNRILFRQGEGDMFVTIFYGVLDLTNGELQYCSAGHTAPWLLRAGGHAETITGSHGNMLGLFNDPELACASLTLTPGSVLFLCTDGVLDAENREEAPFGVSGVRRSLLAVEGASPRELVDAVFAGVSEFSQRMPQNDDLTAVSLRFSGPPLP